MKCQRCEKETVLSVCAKSSDLNGVRYHKEGISTDGYVPNNIGIGGGDYIDFDYCFSCGQMQGDFPIDEDTVLYNLSKQVR